MKTNLFKKTSVLVAFLFISAKLIASGGSWNPLGTPGLSNGISYNTDIAADGLGNKYIVYRDASLQQRATVKKFDGTTWTTIGTPGFTSTIADYPCIAVTQTGTPFIFYRNPVLGKGTVMKYNGTAWVDVGTPGFTPGNCYFLQIILNAANQPCVSFMDPTNGNKLSVMYNNGSAWIALGLGISDGYAENPTMALNNFGNIFCAYKDISLGGKACIKRFDGFAWVNVGSSVTVSPATAYFPCVGVDPSGSVYVAYSDGSGGMGRKVVVKNFVAGNWVTLGGTTATIDRGDCLDLIFDNTGKPLIAFQDRAPSSSNGASVVRYDGTNWGYLGNPNLSGGAIGGIINITIDASGAPCVVYQDVLLGYKPTVMSYNGPLLRILPDNGTGGSMLGIGPDGNPTKEPIGKGSATSKRGDETSIDNNSSTFSETLSEAINPFKEETKNSTAVSSDKDVSFYPNPSNGVINFDSKEELIIAVYDLTGKQVNAFTSNNSIDITSVDNGIYILKATSLSGTTITKRIVKQN